MTDQAADRVMIRIGQVLWFIVTAVAALILMAAALPRYQQLATITLDGTVSSGQLQPGEAQFLERMGLSITLYASYFTILEDWDHWLYWCSGSSYSCAAGMS